MPPLSRICSFAKQRLEGFPKGFDGLRYFWNAVRYHIALARRAVNLPYPTSVLLEFTNCCNLACVTCPRIFRFGKEMDVGSMDPEKAKRLFSEIGIYLDRLCVTGLGESFLYAHGPDVLRHLKRLNPGVEVFISSNLSLPGAPDVFAEWAESVNVLQVSIDGMGATFEKIRRGSSWDRFCENLRAVLAIAREKKIFVKMNMVVFRENFREMPGVVRLAADLGVRELYLNSLNPVAADPALFDVSLYGSSEFRGMLTAAANLAKEKGIALYHPKTMGATPPSACPFPWTAIAITWDGFMVPCCAKPFPTELNFGNVFEKGFKACLNSNEFVDFRKKMKTSSPPEFCRGCR